MLLSYALALHCTIISDLIDFSVQVFMRTAEDCQQKKIQMESVTLSNGKQWTMAKKETKDTHHFDNHKYITENRLMLRKDAS